MAAAATAAGYYQSAQFAHLCVLLLIVVAVLEESLADAKLLLTSKDDCCHNHGDVHVSLQLEVRVMMLGYKRQLAAESYSYSDSRRQLAALQT